MTDARRGGAVAAPSEDSAQAAADLLEAGGSATDAAVAATLVAMVTEPGIVAPGGGALVVVQPPDAPAVALDGNVEMPGRGAPRSRFGAGLREVTTDYGGGVTLTVGHGSVATPGGLAALGEAHARYGRAPWAEVVAPARRLAAEGFRLGTASAYYLDHVRDSVFGWHPESRAALHRPDGTPLVLGDLVRLPDLAATLDLVADEGPRTLYDGALAEAVAADMAAHDGLLSAVDLAAYRVEVGPALPVRVGDWTWSVLPPPSIGGPVLAAMLLLARAVEVPDAVPGTSGASADLARVAHAVLRFRESDLDLAADRVGPASALLDALRADAPGWLRRAALTSPSTAHVSVVDGAGAACAVTSSAGYGSGVVTPGTGMWLNNCLGEPELNRPGVHAWAPGTRLPSNMAPSTGRRADGAVLAAGSPGADRITTALLQVLSRVAGGQPVAAAVDAPRLHVRLGRGAAPDLLEVEEGLSGLEVDGLQTQARPTSMYFGGVGVATRDPDGVLAAAADPRRTGGVRVVPVPV